MELSQWFNTLLQTSADSLIWSVEQVPPKHRQSAPPRHLEVWPVARQIFHMAYYEETLVLPNMRMWLPETAPLSQELLESVEQIGEQELPLEARNDPQTQSRDEEKAWADAQDNKNAEDISKLIERFRAVRASQLVMLPYFDEQAWETSHDATWGDVTLRWIVTKTFQHTAEHTNDILKMALFWR